SPSTTSGYSMNRALLVTALAGCAGCWSDGALPGTSFDTGSTRRDCSAPPDLAPPGIHLTFPSAPRSRIDLLFLVDHSVSMEPMQGELRNRLGQLLKTFQDLADKNGAYADLHIGVVTSDYGAGLHGAPGCSASGVSGGGDQGKLIAVGTNAAVS